MTSAQRVLRVVELAHGVAGSACGRFFAGLGHDVVKCEPPGGEALRRQAPLDTDGTGLAFVALSADKSSVILDADAGFAAGLSALLDSADIFVLDLVPAEADALGITADWLRRSWPDLVVTWITAFARDSEFANLAGDSLLAESYGGLATMIGDPQRAPLSLGGEQIAYCAATTGFLGSMVALMRRDQGNGGDVVEVVMSDVAAYADWKSDLGYYLTGKVPQRAGSKGGEWKMLRGTDGWVGAIFQQQHWKAMVELIDHPTLRDPALADEYTRLQRAVEWWPIVDEWAKDQTAEEIYDRAQVLGLPFGWAPEMSDLMRSEQFVSRGFLTDTPAGEAGRVPAVGSPAYSTSLHWRSGAAPGLGAASVSAPTATAKVVSHHRSQPLEGLVVLDFGAITAGAAVTRLLADFGATVIKVEAADRPDTFRVWKMPAKPGEVTTPGVPRQGSPYFPSNNVGKRAIAVNLTTAEGRAIIHELAAKSHVFVENFRVGVTAKLGIDEPTLHAINPALIYVSLSSQGQDGPESRNRSFGSTLDLLSGLASLTGYDPDRPTWSSSDVNYPDQLVSLMGAAFTVYCLAMQITGAHLDVSQRESVTWTLAAQIADFLVNGHDSEITGNRRPGRTPHDVYRTEGMDSWLAISCSTGEERGALAGVVGSDALLHADESWWWGHQNEADAIITDWTSSKSRDEAVRELRTAGVPAVPVNTAADRLRMPGLVERLVRLPGEGAPVKGFPMRFLEYHVPLHRHAPVIGEDTVDVLTGLLGHSYSEVERLLAEGIAYCPPSSTAPETSAASRGLKPVGSV